MSAREILEEIAEEKGWTKKTMLDLCLEYIDNQDSDDAFQDFLETAAENEDLECAGDPDEEPIDEEDE